MVRVLTESFDVSATEFYERFFTDRHDFWYSMHRSLDGYSELQADPWLKSERQCCLCRKVHFRIETKLPCGVDASRVVQRQRVHFLSTRASNLLSAPSSSSSSSSNKIENESLLSPSSSSSSRDSDLVPVLAEPGGLLDDAICKIVYTTRTCIPDVPYGQTFTCNAVHVLTPDPANDERCCIRVSVFIEWHTEPWFKLMIERMALDGAVNYLSQWLKLSKTMAETVARLRQEQRDEEQDGASVVASSLAGHQRVASANKLVEAKPSPSVDVGVDDNQDESSDVVVASSSSSTTPVAVSNQASNDDVAVAASSSSSPSSSSSLSSSSTSSAAADAMNPSNAVNVGDDGAPPATLVRRVRILDRRVNSPPLLAKRSVAGSPLRSLAASAPAHFATTSSSTPLDDAPSAKPPLRRYVKAVEASDGTKLQTTASVMWRSILQNVVLVGAIVFLLFALPATLFLLWEIDDTEDQLTSISGDREQLGEHLSFLQTVVGILNRSPSNFEEELARFESIISND
jgi:VAD1 Analog of StAR-related lipid transfer domain